VTDYTHLPLLLRPQIRIASVAAGVDRASYASALVGELYGHRTGDDLAALAKEVAARPALTLPDPENVLGNLDDGVAASLRKQSAVLDSAARSNYPAKGETITASYATYVPKAEDGVSAGTVVWVRESDRATVQFVLHRVHVDVTKGSVDELEQQLQPKATPPHPPTLVRTAAAEAVTPKEVFSGILQLATSVSWALPPPWNVVATGGLTLLQLLLGADASPASNPMTKVESDLENYIAGQQLQIYAGDYKDFANQLAAKTKPLTMTAEGLDSSGETYIDDLHAFLIGAFGYEKVHSDNTQVQDALESVVSNHVDKNDFASLDDVTQPLNLIATGVTLWLTGRRISMQILAAEAGHAYALGDQQTFIDTTNSWYSEYTEILDNMLGEDPGWIDAVTGQLDSLTTARLAMIGEPQRATKKEWYSTGTSSGGFPEGFEEDVNGWRFVDTFESDEWAHFVPDTVTTTDGCHGTTTTTQHQDQVQQAHDDYVKSVTAGLDAIVGSARSVAEGWKTSIRDFQQIMPPAPPKTAPSVAAKSGGPSTPQGANWVNGNKVQYAVLFRNETNGPSQIGQWSELLPITTTAYATLTEIPADPQGLTTSVHVYRQFVTADGTTSKPAAIAILKPGQASYDDTRQ
jgi:hypothetical protein